MSPFRWSILLLKLHYFVANLEIYVMGSPQAPHFTDQHPNVYIFETDVQGNPLDLVLPCSIDSPSPTVKYTWFREGERIPQDMINDNGTLVIPNITNGMYASHEGVNYYCIAMNNITDGRKYSAAVRSRTITVFYAFFSGFARIPEVGQTIVEVPIDVALDSDVALECDVLDANPHPTIKWFDSQGVLLSTSDSEVLQNNSIFFLEGGRYLYLRSVGKAQLQQQYYCVVTNALLDREVPSPTRYILNESLPQGELRTYKDIGDLTAFVGNTSYEFSYVGGVYGCGNTTNPFSVFNGTLNRMFADGAEVAVRGNIGIIDVISSAGTVVLRAQVIYDGGITNMLGSLTVYEVPAITSNIQDERLHFVGEENLVYTCEFTGTPTPILVFYFNGESITSDGSINIIGNTLTIISPQVNNFGIYQCIVSNEYGDDQLAWLLEIREPLTPILERATVINTTSIQLSWSVSSESAEAVTGYRISIVTADRQLNISIGLMTTWLINDLAPNTTYTFQIAALYGEIEGPPSNYIAAKTDIENQVCEELFLPERGIGHIEYSNNRSIGSNATYIHFECERNYKQSGDLILKCSKSGWKGQPPTCSNDSSMSAPVPVIIASTIVPAVVGIILLLLNVVISICIKKRNGRHSILNVTNPVNQHSELEDSTVPPISMTSDIMCHESTEYLPRVSATVSATHQCGSIVDVELCDSRRALGQAEAESLFDHAHTAKDIPLVPIQSSTESDPRYDITLQVAGDLLPSSPTSSSSNSMVPQSHKILCDKQLSIIFRELTDVAVRWKNIGILLGVPQSKLNVISANQREVYDCLQEMLHVWLRLDTLPTWEDLAKAVEPFDRLKAEDIRRRYVEPQ